MGMLGGVGGTFEDFVAGTRAEVKNLRAGWIVGGYLSNWIPANQPAQFKKAFRVVQDILPTSLSEAAEVVLPGAAWAEKDGCWENYAGKIQAFSAAIRPVEGARREGDVYLSLLGRKGMYQAEQIRKEMGEPFAAVKVAGVREEERRLEFVEL
jgi:anaerobic selenocysteine-containing dehydrogenase